MIRIILTAILITLSAAAHAQVVPTLIGYHEVRTNGNNSTYGSGLTHRYVNGELRFLTLALGGVVHEFRIVGTPLGGTITQTTGTWNLGPLDVLWAFSGLWFEQDKNRLWIASGPDYTATYEPGYIALVSLNTDGTATKLKDFRLSVPAKRAYGGCNKVPASLVAQLGGPYVCGWGGYTSLVEQGGGASVGPTMYAIPDPDTIAAGSTVTVRTVLDTAPQSAHRGLRVTLPTNYYDGGDPRPNPPTRPTSPPLGTAGWLSPNAQGQGWMVWGDSYYNTGVWIGTTYAAVMSGCKGSCWYESSTLAFDGRQFELHQWNGATLGADRLKRPDSMVELPIVPANDRVWSGNVPTGNISGATYDATTGTLYLIGFPFGEDYYTGRLYAFALGPGPTPPTSPTPTPTPVPETVTHEDLAAILAEIKAALVVQTYTVTVTSVGSSYANGDRRITIRVPVASMPTAPKTGDTLTIKR